MRISAVILTKNEEKMLEACLKTLIWVDEVIVIDDQSTDNTISISKKYGARVIDGKSDFADNRNLGKSAAKGDWVLYVDADERVSKILAKEIKSVLKNPKHFAYSLKRLNYQIGKHLVWGGWGDDKVVRLFKKTSLSKWAGRI